MQVVRSSAGASPTPPERAPGFDSDLESMLLEGLEDAPEPEDSSDETRFASPEADTGPRADGGLDAMPLPGADGLEGPTDRTAPPPFPDWNPPPEPAPSPEPDLESALVDGLDDAPEPEELPGATDFADLGPETDSGPPPLAGTHDHERFLDRALIPPLPDRGPSPDLERDSEPDFETALAEDLAGTSGPEESAAADLADLFPETDFGPAFDPGPHAREETPDRTFLPPLPDRSPPPEPAPSPEPDLESALVDGLDDAPAPEELPGATDFADLGPETDSGLPPLTGTHDHERFPDRALIPPLPDRGSSPDSERDSEPDLGPAPAEDLAGTSGPEESAVAAADLADLFPETDFGPAFDSGPHAREETPDRTFLPPLPDWSAPLEPAPSPEPDLESALIDGLENAPEPEELPGATDFADLGPETDSGSPLVAGTHDREQLPDRALIPPPLDRGSSPESEPDAEIDFGTALAEDLAGTSEPEESAASALADLFPETDLEPASDSGPHAREESRDGTFLPPLPDRSPPLEPAPSPEPDLESALIDGLDDAPEPEGLVPPDGPTGTEAEFEPAASPFPDARRSGAPGDGAPRPEWASPPVPDHEQTLLEGLANVPDPDPWSSGMDAAGFPPAPDPTPSLEAAEFRPAAGHTPPSLADWSSPREPNVEETLLDGLADAPDPEEIAAERDASESTNESLEEPFDVHPVSVFAGPSGAADALSTAPDPGPATGDDVLAATEGEPAALAFAADPETESALREGLADLADPLVWPGGLRTAIEVLAGGHTSRLIFVDLDESSYPAGAIHELAAVCEVGTVVVALGSNGTARFSREILLAGVSDYLVKPVTADSVREAAARATSPAPREFEGGWSVGFTGTGGSGATTVAAATALLAAERGRYVSVLDLNRTFPALSFLLDVEPAAGLVELLSTAARASLHPEMVDGMRTERSERIAVYGYPWSALPPPLAPVWAVCELLVELQRRSHLVLIDGLDDPATRLALLALVDARVLVVEPTPEGAARAAHVLGRFGPMFDEEWPFLFVQNHTRAFKSEAGAMALDDAGIEAPADVVIPFEPSLPAVADRGWPRGRIPKSLHKSFDFLTDRVLAGGKAAAAPAHV